MDKTEKIFTLTKNFNASEIKLNNIVLLKQSYWKPFCLKNLWILLITILPLSGIIIGWIFRNDCSIEKYIPIWEIINGLMTICFLLLMCITKQIIKYEHPNWIIFIFDQLKILFIFLLFAWFICGNVSEKFFPKNFLILFYIYQIWVYKYYKIVNYDKSLISKKNFYCNKILYLHAFWYMTVIYILLSVCLIYFIFSLIYNCIKKQ